MNTPIPTYIAFDTETGGLDPRTSSLLTIYLVILDQDWNMMWDLELYVKPDDGVYHVNAIALKINDINLVTHDVMAITYKEAATKIYDFLSLANEKTKHLVPIGHNVNFDIDFITTHTIAKKTWDVFVGYRKLDTGTLAQALMSAGHLPADMNAGLGVLAKFFDIEFLAHTAKGDTWATVDICRAMLKMIQK